MTNKHIKLTSQDIYKNIPSSIIDIESTKDLISYDLKFNSYKAVDAIQSGLYFKDNNHNIFIISDNSIEITNMMLNIIKNQTLCNDLYDWVYVSSNNIYNEYYPLSVPITCAYSFKQDIDNLKINLKDKIISFLQSTKYKNIVQKIHNNIKKQKELVLNQIKDEAKSYDLIINEDQNEKYEFSVSPSDKNGKLINQDQFNALETSKQKYLQSKALLITKKLNIAIKVLNKLDNKQYGLIEKNITQFLFKDLKETIKPLQKKWKTESKILKYLNNISNHIINKLKNYIMHPEDHNISLDLDNCLRIFVLHSHNNKNSQNIIIDYKNESLFSTLEYSKDLQNNDLNIERINPGLLHKANGGILILNIKNILENGLLWQKFKRMLLNKTLPLFDDNYMKSETIKIFRPLPIELDIKIILIGDKKTYCQLKNQDTIFSYLFKVIAEFDDKMLINKENILNTSILIAHRIEDMKIKHLSKDALLHVLEIASLYAENQSYISTNLAIIIEIIQEASLISHHKENQPYISLEDIEQAFAKQKTRSNSLSLLDETNIKNKSLLLDTKGTKVGQINAIYASSFNGFNFGHPQRITAVVYKNSKSKIIHTDIQVNLSGQIHSKAVMVLEAYINSTFGKNTQLGFVASITFEQSYQAINGDSASCAETISVLSALSEVPIKQGISISGSMDQKGNIQPVSLLNAKIEGYFNICKHIGLDGCQGVIIPKANVQNLMLNQEIRMAVDQNLFNIFPVEHVNDIIEIMMDNKIGYLDKSHTFEPNSIGDLIIKKWAVNNTNYLKNQK